MSKIILIFVQRNTHMEKLAYTNKFGDTIYENVERFDIRGTIMSRTIHKVGDMILYRLWVEDSNGGKHVTIWSSAKGFDSTKLGIGEHSVRFKGFIRTNYYCGADGKEKEYKEYKAQEMSL